MNTEVGGDLLQRHAGLTVPGDAHDVVAVLAGVGLGHSDILPGCLMGKPASVSPDHAADPPVIPLSVSASGDGRLAVGLLDGRILRLERSGTTVE
ncbi:hypothetical protein GCM10023225_09490 [Kineococcus glutinatus]|uniref:Uncharacterized protein n=1 Tax=Kineococcus glutinatus TaxID=1070872 RepID=A0ABP9HF19_9ACTN